MRTNKPRLSTNMNNQPSTVRPDVPALETASQSAPSQVPKSLMTSHLWESLVVLAIGFSLMAFVYGPSVNEAGKPTGVPGNDSFYHIKMAGMFFETGVLDEFSWLKFSYFTSEGTDFVDHHYGYHAILAPFVTLSQSLTGDYLVGARWASCILFGLNLMLFNCVLIQSGVQWRFVWLLLFMLLPTQFFTRHAFIRAVAPSLTMMLLMVLAMLRRRHILLAIVIAAYIHLYLGGVVYAPMIVGAFFAASVFGPRCDRRIPWGVLVGGVCGWLIGIATHPHFEHIGEFLRLQIFGSGLSPDISVGREWKPYNGVWWFAQMAGTVLLVWVVAIGVRLRLGPNLKSFDLFLFLVTIAFFVLTLKARRFIEYWPIFCLLCSATLTQPHIGRLAQWFNQSRAAGQRLAIATILTIALLCVAIYVQPQGDFMAYWPGWLALSAVYLLIPLRSMWKQFHLNPSMGSYVQWSLVARVMVMFTATLLATATFASTPWNQIRQGVRGKYDLSAVRDVMRFVADHSEMGDVIFTDDWDIFPVFFYYNTFNHYVVGLDPKFTHERRPDLWERYVKITRGQIPTGVTVNMPGEEEPRKLHVKLSDIRDHFGARFVVTDRDHKALAAKLAAAKRFAELIYPPLPYSDVRDNPYLVFRILDTNE